MEKEQSLLERSVGMQQNKAQHPPGAKEIEW
jgi:hypothetical protein